MIRRTPIIEWVDPPPREHGPRSVAGAIRLALCKRPGEWAWVATGTGVELQNLRKSIQRGTQDFEVTARKDKLYARYTGEEEM